MPLLMGEADDFSHYSIISSPIYVDFIQLKLPSKEVTLTAKDDDIVAISNLRTLSVHYPCLSSLSLLKQITHKGATTLTTKKAHCTAARSNVHFITFLSICIQSNRCFIKKRTMELCQTWIQMAVSGKSPFPLFSLFVNITKMGIYNSLLQSQVGFLMYTTR